MAGPVMDAACLTYEGFAVDPVETYFNTEEPVWILGKHFRPDEGDELMIDCLRPRPRPN